MSLLSVDEIDSKRNFAQVHNLNNDLHNQAFAKWGTKLTVARNCQFNLFYGG
jgi:hypothetical protein